MKRVWVAIVIMFVALAGVVGWQVLKPSEPSEPEPVYNGRTLTSWVEAYQSGYWGLAGSNMRTQVDAVRHIGTNAIPTLLRMLRARDLALKVKLMPLLRRQHVINISYTPATDQNRLAATGFAMLGADAQSAVPALIEIGNQYGSAASRSYVIYALRGIGPSAKQAVPSLLRWTSNADPIVRREATNALLKIDPEAAAKAGITNTVP